MGLPVIDVKFTQLTETAVARSERGIVALLLEENNGNTETLKTASEAGAGWSTEAKGYIAAAFEGGAYRVIAIGAELSGSTADYDATLKKADALTWNWLAAPSASADNVAKIVTYIKGARALGRTKKAVVAGALSPDSEGIVNMTAGNITSTVTGAAKTYTAQQYTPRIAGVLAGLALDKSATGYVLDDVVSADAPEDPGAEIDAGRFAIVFDGEDYVCGRGVTSLTGTSEKPSLFKKIKHVEGADLMSDDMALIFKARYKGKKANTYANKQTLMAELSGYLKGLQGTVLSGDFDNAAVIDADAQKAYLIAVGEYAEGMSDIAVIKSDTADKVFAKANVLFADAMEDVYISVVMG